LCSLVKVLLTVSPFRPSFSSRHDPYSHSFDSCSRSSSADAELLPTIHRSLPTLRELSPLSTVFTPNRPLNALSTPLTQIGRGVGYLKHLLGPVVSVTIDFQTLCSQGLANPFSRNSFHCTSIQNPRGVPVPPEISGKATVFLLERSGYTEVRHGSNGFSCLIDRQSRSISGSPASTRKEAPPLWLLGCLWRSNAAGARPKSR
jgi:hypothetical protein